MKAAVFTQYGGPEVLRITEIPTPVPGDHDVLIRVHATAVNSADCRLRGANPAAVRLFFGFFKPRRQVLGGVLSGVVTSVGSKVTKFKPGDEVFGATNLHFGANADYCRLPETCALAHKPTGMSHEEAAALPFGGITALHFLQKAGIRAGQDVLVYGASGAVGSAAVQIASALGATVTGVCSAANAALVKSLGATTVLDYTKTDIGTLQGRFDIVYETVDKASFDSCRAALKPGGTLILGAAMGGNMLRAAWANLTGRIRAITGVSDETPEAVETLRQMAESGLLKAVVDRIYSLDQIAEAHAYVEGGHKRGNVVIRMV